MAPSDYLGETWRELCDRVGEEQLRGWARREPTLARFTDLQTLRYELRRGEPEWADEVFIALLRLAAADNGDDRDAALLVAHLMHNASGVVAVSLQDLSPDIDAIVAAELWVQIRSYRWQHRRRGHALGLKRDTRAGVLRELAYSRREHQPPAVPLPPNIVSWVIDSRADRAAESGLQPTAVVDAEDELLDLLTWAERTGVLTDADVHLLREVGLAGGVRGRAAAAAEYGIADRQLRRRCQQAKDRLHQARLAYLAQAA